MSFTRAKPAGWATLEQITPAQINQIDTNQSNAIDGAAGGDYTPTNPIGLSNDLEIKSGADLIVETGATAVVQSGGLLTVSTGATVSVSSDLDMLSGADIELGALSEIKTTNVRFCLVTVPLVIRSRNTTAGGGAANNFPLYWGYGGTSADYPGLPIQTDLTGPAEWVAYAIPLLPQTATIVSYSAVVSPDVVSRAALPGTTVPGMRLIRYNASGVRTVVDFTEDASPSVITYESPHNINSPTLSEATANNWYVIEVRGETGTDSAIGLQLVRLSLTYTTARVNHQWGELTLA